jgi:DNA polymerase elongation subunit (family B)
LHFGVAELDFASMYPAIMARFNVSPETIHCTCCPESRVPEIGYSICRRERGLIPETLAPLIEKRLTYKRRLKQASSNAEKESYRRRSAAHKWLLVTCFGYLGYKNARFGRIEAHEAVTAYGREMLLRAKEIVEARGFRVLHMLTDSLWIHKAGTSDAEYEQLTSAIEQTTNLPIELESIYKWVAFLPSRVNLYASVPNRYFGAKRDGELKARGIEARRGDTPTFIRDAQIDLLKEMAQASTRVELAAMLPSLLERIRAYERQLRAGQVPHEDLAFTFRLSRAPQAYVVNNLNAIVAREFARRGVQLEAGESIRYVITNYRAKEPSGRVRAMELLGDSQTYDAERYTEMLLRATETVLAPLGISATMLEDWRAWALPSRSLQARVARNSARDYWGALFE